MKTKMMVGAACVLLAGCDYTVPLVKTPDTPLDPAATGLWQRSGADGKTESLLVLPLNKLEYLVVFPAGSRDAMFARACLWRSAALTLMQVDWFGNARGNVPEDGRTFQYVSYTADSQKLTLRLLNPDIVPKDIASPDTLARTIVENKDKPNLFREEMAFQKVNN